jgi:hypothetical protein
MSPSTPGRLLVSTRKGLFTVDADASTPEVVDAAFIGVPVTVAELDRRDGTAYASLNHGHFGQKLHRSDDGGSSWVEVGSPEYPPRPEGVVDICPMRQIDRPWSTQLIWDLVPGHGGRPGEIWAGTIPGGLFRSRDRGDSWELIRSLWDRPERAQAMGGGYDYPGIHSILVDPRSPDSLQVALSCGGSWFTDDDGETWDVARGMRANFLPPDMAEDPFTQDPHRLVRCPTEPDVLWTQHHCGIFRSTDNGRTYSEIAEAGPSTFGFAVAVHPFDPDTAWFVPAVSDEVRVPVDGRMVVTRTRDGGRTFDVLSAGLPQEHAYHLAYRHGLAVDETGERLAVSSTTGSLWLSDDAGDHWRLISADFPPIHAVTWA